jgi:hydroxypyruvate isomerase
VTIKQSAAWWCYVRGGVAPEVFVRMLAEIGYAGVDLAPPEFWPLIRDHGLALAAVNGHQSIISGLNRREEHARIERELLENIRQAEQWGAANLICFSGSRAGQPDSEGAQIAAEGLRRVARAAEDAGVTLVLELLNSRVDHPDYQFDNMRWGVQVCELVNSPSVRILYDIYHAQIMEGDLIRTIQAHAPLIAHYHTAGNPGRHELDEYQEIYYPPIVHAITATGYAGYLCHEFVPRGDTAATLRAAFELCAAA